MATQQVLDYYRTGGLHSRCDEPELPATPREIAATVQGLLLHEHVAPAYGVTLTPERRLESHLRSAADVLQRIREHNPSALTAVRTLDERTVGTCRNLSLLGVAALRSRGVPARARCGFGTYFEPGKYVDHWVVEYWDAARAAWVLVDMQLDAVQRDTFGIEFDVLDVPRDQFVVAGDAWERYRSGRAEGAAFGIMELNGAWFIAGNVVRDIAALNKVEMLPWDVWGAMPQPDDTGWESRFDELAALSSHPDEHFEALRLRYREDEALRVPAIVFNAVLQRPEPVADLAASG